MFQGTVRAPLSILIGFICFSCITINAWGNHMDDIKKWKKAVVHLKCARDDESIIDLFVKRDKKEITEEEFNKGFQEKYNKDRFHGTAVFLIHNKRRYLITAQHVVYNEKPYYFELEEFPDEDLKGLPAEERSKEIMKRLKFYEEAAPHRIYARIFRVPSLDEFLENQDEYLASPNWLIGETYGLISKDDSIGFNLLANLSAGPPDRAPYTFLDPQLNPNSILKDIAIISLDQRNSEFADELIRKGYKPITIEDVADGPSSEGAEIFSVGYPQTSLIGKLPKSKYLAAWSSAFISLPIFSFGRVAMLSDHLDYFWSDISIYPGNSGGPVIENGKLVGIVSKQASVESSRIPFGKIINSKFIKELLNIQIQKDKKSNS